MPGPTNYATPADVRGYVTATSLDVPADDDELAKIIVLAEIDIDSVVGEVAKDPATGRKYDLASLTGYRATALTRAACAQTEYRLMRGETFMAEGQYAQVRIETEQAAEFRAGTLPYVGRKAMQELEAGDLLVRDLGVL